MAVDIYQRRNELQSKIQGFDQKMKEVDDTFKREQDQINADPASSLVVPVGRNQAYQARREAKGRRDAAYNWNFVERDKYQKMLDEENQRVSALEPFAKLQQEQLGRAQQFRQAFPSILDSRLGTARTQMRRDIAEGVGNVRAGMNQRGLLFSNMRAGQEADVGQDAEMRLADTAVKTNQELMDAQNDLDQQAIATGVTMGNISKDLASTNAEYRKALIDQLLEQDKQKQAAIGGLIGTGAQLAGMSLGAAIKPGKEKEK